MIDDKETLSEISKPYNVSMTTSNQSNDLIDISETLDEISKQNDVSEITHSQSEHSM